MRADWLSDTSLKAVLMAMLPINSLAVEVSAATGLRLGDVLLLKTDKLAERVTVKEQKTGKSRRVYIPRSLLRRMLAIAGSVWVFEHRTDRTKHRTRQAVYRDMKQCADFFKHNGIVPRKAQISPHSARKIAAVHERNRTGNAAAVAKLLNHSGGGNSAVTAIYANADFISEGKKRGAKNELGG